LIRIKCRGEAPRHSGAMTDALHALAPDRAEAAQSVRA
jgi:hypothetical protein